MYGTGSYQHLWPDGVAIEGLDCYALPGMVVC